MRSLPHCLRDAMSLPAVPGAWRSAASRLILVYGALFALWALLLLGVVQWEATRYLNGVIDQLLEQRMRYLLATEPTQLPAAVAAASAIDPNGLMALGLFDREGTRLAGNIVRVPDALPADGAVHLLGRGLPRTAEGRASRARVLATRLGDGRLLVVARDTSTIDGLGAIIRRALVWGLSLTLIPGVLGGLLLHRGHLRRIRALAAATEPIRRGDLARRLPVSRRGDELDQLAGIVNGMLDEIERLLSEVKGVCDNIAHDLRTPLTHLRARLYRVQQQLADRPQAALLDACMGDIDAVLVRFRALLRISELEERQRADFGVVDPAELLRQVHECYAPLAEDRGQRFVLDLATNARLHGDAHLLFEALANLVGNAIKFAPPGGEIQLRMLATTAGTCIEVCDDGPGIPEQEREMVTRRFYRGDKSRHQPGSGLGLSIVSAIARLHGFTLEIDRSQRGGARIALHCPARAGHPAVMDLAPP
ncbi:sensor histidine kinase [Aerosticca soli]|uniref:histidine kinase n=1 Tax=Aerosticca soli TaxID=2010829 RepID=A0A2Z6E8V6_9GAMM|nr:HAMP domain-containing sensor histidine kinase [Aerosticca soli]MDI3262818.1 HAMP domain-containing sensor histidine kinase [Fulvimonas sp.]BBD81244.1 two-component sensor histidine kinase [Aerosticca soli]